MRRLFLISGILPSFLLATIINVPADSSTIQGGINGASDGDTVIVAKGEYFENVIIEKSLVLIGENPDSTIINADSLDKGIYVYITSSPSQGVIKGFTIKNSGVGYTDGVSNNGVVIKTSGKGNWIVSNNIIRDNTKSGIVTSDHGTIANNLIFSNDLYGVFVTQDANTSIINNTISNNGHIGIFSHSQSDSVSIFNNIITWNGSQGIALECSYEIDYNNVFDNDYGDYSNCVPGLGSISNDPLFVDTSMFDFRLSAESLCIDSGHPDLDRDGDSCVRVMSH